MENSKLNIEEVIKVIKTLKEENHKLKVENEELKDVFSKVLNLFKNDKEAFLKVIKKEINTKTVISGYQLIDLGLPSRTLWMDRNVGASSPEDAGLYFAWGETNGYTADEVGKTKQFGWDNYKFGKKEALTKYNSIDGLIKLDTKDDSVLQNTHKFKMPTKMQLQELLDNTISTWITQNGVNGRLFTSKTNGNSIFVPADGCGCYGSMNNVGSFGGLWSSSLNEDCTYDAWGLSFDSDYVGIYGGDRCYGRSIRAILID